MMLYAAIYTLAIAAYAAAIRIAALFNPKAALFVSGRKGLLPAMRKALAGDTRKRIWMHCASLGEFEQGRPVLEALHKRYPNYCIVLTFFSPSGYEVRKSYAGADHVFYLPMDGPANAKAFLDIVDPALCIFVKYEFWYHYLNGIRQRGISAVLVSAIFHKEQGFFKWYGSLFRKMLRSFTHIFVQDAASAELLKSIAIDHVSISGDTRFDRVIDAAEHAEPLAAIETFAQDHKLLVAGSTWKEDEQLLQATLPLLSGQWKLVLVPHEVHAEHLQQIEQLFPEDMVRWTRYGQAKGNERVLLVDKVGLLLQIYQYAHVAWIGGGFGKDGVHNVLEAAVYGVPCAYGPIFQQFLEAQELIDNGGAFSVATPEAFAARVQHCEDTDRYSIHATAARAYVYAKGGATGIVMGYLQGLLS